MLFSFFYRRNFEEADSRYYITLIAFILQGGIKENNRINT